MKAKIFFTNMVLFFLQCILANILFAQQKNVALPVAETISQQSITFKAYIDGSDYIHIRRNKVWYVHRNYQLPGKWDGANEPTYINGNPWFPNWSHNTSDKYTGLKPSLPSKNISGVTLEIISARESMLIVQMPSAENDYEAIILADDDPPGGPYWYEFKLMWTGPAPLSVNIIQPLNEKIFEAPAKIRITANAHSRDGKIKTVDFYNGDSLIFTEHKSLYDRYWIDVPAGNYSITARATDDNGLIATSTPVNISVVDLPPRISLINPANNLTYTAPASIKIIAAAIDAGGINKVEFYNGATLLHTEYKPDYDFNWQNVPEGNYTLIAKAFDKSGLTASSDSVLIVVVNLPPVVTITNTLNDTTYVEPATITLSAEANDPDGKIKKVDFYNGNNIIFTEYSNPFVRKWYNVPAGSYTITAKATDNNGKVTTSSPVVIVVNSIEPPIVDTDGDGVPDDLDNCPDVANADQSDIDNDGIGDVCDNDNDNDGTPDIDDCAPLNAAVHPGAAEICNNGIDDNCNGQIDEGCNSFCASSGASDCPLPFNLGISALRNNGDALYWDPHLGPGNDTLIELATADESNTILHHIIFANVRRNLYFYSALPVGVPAPQSPHGMYDYYDNGTYHWRIRLKCTNGSWTSWVCGPDFTIPYSGQHRPSLTLDPKNAYGHNLITNDKTRVKIYPNPFQSAFKVECADSKNDQKTIILSDVIGREISTQKTLQNITEINVNNLARGIYFLKIKDEHGNILYSGKVMKE